MNFTPFRPGELAAHGIDPYDSPPRRRKIFLVVLTAHALLILVPLIWLHISRLLDPPKIVMKVGLVDLPEGNSLDVPKDQTGKPEKPSATAEPEPAQPVPEPPAPEPVKTETPPPKTETPPKLETPPKAETPKIKTPPKTETPPKVKTPKKEEPKKEKPKYLRPEDIKKTGKRVKTDKPDPKAEAQRKAAEQARADAERKAAEARREIAEGARNAARPVYGSIAGGEKGIPATKEYYDYIDELKRTVEQRWNQPNSVELEGRRPEAKITLTIRKDGTVEKADFARTGIQPMDQSLENLRSRLKAVPPPPQAMEIEITLRVK